VRARIPMTMLIRIMMLCGHNRCVSLSSKVSLFHTSSLYIITILFFFNGTATTEIYTLSLHDALPIFSKNVSVSCAYTQGKREQFSGFNRTLDAINNVFRKFSAFHDETGRLNVDGMNIISNDGSNKLNRSRKARVSY